MDGELRRIGQFLWRTFVRDADMVDRVVEVLGGIGAVVSGHQLGWKPTVAILVITALFVLGRRAYFLDEKSQPHIELRFGDSEKYITGTPIQGITTTRDIKVAFVGYARYVRVEAINRSELTAHNCSAYLLAVKRQGPNGEWLETEFTDPMPLKWSNEQRIAIDLHSEIHTYFDVLSVRDNVPKLILEIAKPLPLRLIDLCSQPGVYRLRVCVRGDEAAKSKTLAIEVNWTGTVEGLTAEVSTWRAANT